MIQRDKVFEKVPGESIFRVLSWTKKDTNGGEQNDCNSTSTSADADTDTDNTVWKEADRSGNSDVRSRTAAHTQEPR